MGAAEIVVVIVAGVAVAAVGSWIIVSTAARHARRRHDQGPGGAPDAG